MKEPTIMTTKEVRGLVRELRRTDPGRSVKTPPGKVRVVGRTGIVLFTARKLSPQEQIESRQRDKWACRKFGSVWA